MRANQCPNCGSTVSQFAAGCAICGADLEVLRRRGRRRRPPTLSAPALPRMGSDSLRPVLLAVLLLALALYGPLYGLLFSGLVAFDRNRHGDRLMRNVALACVALAAFDLFAIAWPASRFGPIPR